MVPADRDDGCSDNDDEPDPAGHVHAMVAWVRRLQLGQVVDQGELDEFGPVIDCLDEVLENRGLDLKQGDGCRRDQHRVVERLDS